MIRSIRRTIALVVALVATFAAGTAWADGEFEDVDSRSSHANNIYAIRNAGITVGCFDTAHYCPGDNVTRAQMASFLARAMGLSNGTTKNFPKANARSPLQTFCAIAMASPGSFRAPMCGAGPRTVDSAGDVGRGTSIAFGTNGLPTINYLGDPNDTDYFVRCADLLCTTSTRKVGFASHAIPQTVLAIAGSGYRYSLFMNNPSQDIPFSMATISYCSEESCETSPKGGWNNLTPAVTNGYSMAVDPQGLPWVVYAKSTEPGADLVGFRCTIATCERQGGQTNLVFDNQGFNFGYPSLAFGADGLAAISYFDLDHRDLLFVRCAHAPCEEKSAPVLIDEGEVDPYSSMTIGTDGKPIIAYTIGDGAELWVAHCLEADCSKVSRSAVGGTGASRPAIAIGTDGLALIAYYEPVGGDLRLARCTTVACANAPSTILDSAGNTGQFPSIAVGPDGIPAIAYYDATNRDLRFVRPAAA